MEGVKLSSNSHQAVSKALRIAAISEVPMSFGILRASHSPSSSACLADLVLAAIHAVTTLLALIRLGRSFGSSPKFFSSKASRSPWSLATTDNSSTLVTPMW